MAYLLHTPLVTLEVSLTLDCAANSRFPDSIIGSAPRAQPHATPLDDDQGSLAELLQTNHLDYLRIKKRVFLAKTRPGI